jgi:RimJ/RimL family protein N-acetyltransferase
MAWSPHADLLETQAFLEGVERSHETGVALHWTIRHEGEVIGLFSLIDIRRRHRAITYDRAELAYWLAPAHQRQGFMSEAGREVVRAAFEDLGLENLVVAHHVGNAASEGLIRRLGFVHSHREDRAFRKGDVWIDCLHYRLSRPVWQQTRDENPN